jgi:hypothetical protein
MCPVTWSVEEATPLTFWSQDNNHSFLLPRDLLFRNHPLPIELQNLHKHHRLFSENQEYLHRSIEYSY